ncbi:hypothetical protein FQN55_007462 [Onygenales sp. PD_40]|nr:hypothetical protein FQN55_007462 [Onygenales sp. PD_40]
MAIPTDPTVTEPVSDSNHARRRARGRRKRQARKRKKFQQPDSDASYEEKPQETRSPSMMDKKQLYEHYKSMEEAHRIELQKLQGELERCQKFKRAYLALCGNLDGGEMDDEKIRTLFSEARELCSSWANTFSSPGPLTRDDELAIKNTNPAAMDESDLESIFAALRGEEYGKYIVLHSFISHFICQRIIDRPFFFLGPWRNRPSTNCDNDIEESLRKLMKSCPNKLNNDSLPAWVFDTLYLLQPGFYKGKTENPEWTTRRREKFYRNATDAFLHATPDVLLRPLSGEEDTKARFDELKEAIRASGELVLKLRNQKVGIYSAGRASKNLKGMDFQRSSPTFEPHLCMLLGPHDNRLDGKQINFVVEPAILATWVDKETGTRLEKCWSKAVVWVARQEQVFRGEAPVGNDNNIALDSIAEDRSSQTPENSATHAHSRNSQHSSDSDVAMLDLSSNVGQQQQEAESTCQALKIDGKGTNLQENEMGYTMDLDDQHALGRTQGSSPRTNSTSLKMGQQGFLGKESGNVEGQGISTASNPEPTPATQKETIYPAGCPPHTTEAAPSVREEHLHMLLISDSEDDDENSGGFERIQDSHLEETRIAGGSNVEQCDRIPDEISDERHALDFAPAQKGTPDRTQRICDPTGMEETPTAALLPDEKCMISGRIEPNPQSRHMDVTKFAPNPSHSIQPPSSMHSATITASEGEEASPNNDVYKNERSENYWGGF